MTERRSTSYALRAIVINALLILSFVQVQRTGSVTGKLIALYVGMAVVANVLMYFGARARRRFQNR